MPSVHTTTDPIIVKIASRNILLGRNCGYRETLIGYDVVVASFLTMTPACKSKKTMVGEISQGSTRADRTLGSKEKKDFHFHVASKLSQRKSTTDAKDSYSCELWKDPKHME